MTENHISANVEDVGVCSFVSAHTYCGFIMPLQNGGDVS